MNEYANIGIIVKEKQGKKIYYRRSNDIDISKYNNAINFASEYAPCGVVGSFLLDKTIGQNDIFGFKHHYITNAIDSEIMCIIFDAMHMHKIITADNTSKKTGLISKSLQLVPMKIYISSQNGRQNLIAYNIKTRHFSTYRLDYLSNLRIGNKCKYYADYKTKFDEYEKYIWGVSCGRSMNDLQRVELIIEVKEYEKHIVNRLQREKRCGTVEKIDNTHYKYYADVFNSMELVPWIRTFICRITKVYFSDKKVEEIFKNDIVTMAKVYGVK